MVTDHDHVQSGEHLDAGLPTMAAGSGVQKDVPSVSDMQYAGFWSRFIAWVVDVAALCMLAFVLAIILPILLGPLIGLPGDAAILASIIVFWIVVPWLYWALMESSSRQATLGKKTMGLTVSDMAGNRISFVRATKRYWAKVLSTLMPLAGFVMIGFTAKKQGLHDIIARCLVMAKKQPEEQP